MTEKLSKEKRLAVPSAVRIKLGPARRMYVQRLLGRGLFGDTPDEVVDIVFCRGLQELVPPEWMRQASGMKVRR